ncbi:MAG: nuclear transport factor 2 family protein [Acidobacteria bacterium]|nr:nuclear transport factor 2 family protein [Acidobacteriota bacterium]
MNLREEIIQLSEEWSRAIVANDVAAIDSYMTDEWILVSDHGVLTREMFLSLVSSGQLGHEKMETVEVGAFHEYGDTVVLASRVESIAIFGGRRIEANEWTSDVFVSTDNGWKCAITHVTPVKE